MQIEYVVNNMIMRFAEVVNVHLLVLSLNQLYVYLRSISR